MSTPNTALAPIPYRNDAAPPVISVGTRSYVNYNADPPMFTNKVNILSGTCFAALTQVQYPAEKLVHTYGKLEFYIHPSASPYSWTWQLDAGESGSGTVNHAYIDWRVIPNPNGDSIAADSVNVGPAGQTSIFGEAVSASVLEFSGNTSTLAAYDFPPIFVDMWVPMP